MHMTKPWPFLPRQAGISMLEVMVAIVLMAFGILSVIGMQLRTLSNAQDSVRRTQAIRLIDDLSDRLRLLPNAYEQAESYWMDWNSKPDPTAFHACSTSPLQCNAAQFAQADANRWLASVHSGLPLGQAHVFATDDVRQLGVMLAWRSNENNDQATQALAPPSTGEGNIQCPTNRMCHLQYISLTQRCVPIDTTKAYCP